MRVALLNMKFYFKCPRCKKDERFSMPYEASSDVGCALLLFGGLIPAIIYEDSRKKRVQCAECGLIFKQPALPKTPVSRMAGWIVGIMVVGFLLTLILIIFSDLIALIPDYGVILYLEAIVAKNPMAIALGMITVMLALLFLAMISSLVSSRKANKKLREKFQTKASPYYFSAKADKEADKEAGSTPHSDRSE